MTKRPSSLPNLLMPIVWIGAFLSYLYYRYAGFFQNLSGLKLFVLNFIFFVAGVLGGILTERFFSWGGKPLFKVAPREGEDRSSHLRKMLVKWGLIYAVGLGSVILIVLLWVSANPLLQLSLSTKWNLFFFSFAAGALGGTLIPYLVELLRTAPEERKG